MAAFLMEGGLENEIKEQKAKVEEEKKQERIEAGVEATEEDEEIVYEDEQILTVKLGFDVLSGFAKEDTVGS